jgi:hypothetical protein
MFKKQPNGVEVYFTWPSRSGRIVPNKTVRTGIVLRDNAIAGLVGVMVLVTALLEQPNIPVGIGMGILLSRVGERDIDIGPNWQGFRSKLPMCPVPRPLAIVHVRLCG